VHEIGLPTLVQIADKSRVAKTLHTSHPPGPRPMLRSFSTEYDEAAFIAYEIKRMMAQSGGMLGFGDFAVLRTSLPNTSNCSLTIHSAF
jgi:superfamily I DNA/RNA helicase